jgi:hypothetical protein
VRALPKECAGDLKRGGALATYQEFAGDCRAGRIVLVPCGEQVFTAAEEIVRLAFRRAQPVMVRSLDAIHVASAVTAPRESHGRNRYSIAAGGGDGKVEAGAVTQPSQPVQRHNGRMGFAARILLVIAARRRVARRSIRRSRGQSETAPNLKALMARGVQAYDARNDSVALGIFRQAAVMGNVDAMMYLGVMYGTGRGVNLDYATAMAWFRHAADAENSQAMCNIGLLYLKGWACRRATARP